MLIALARKLAIALWRYVETGLIPEGATITTGQNTVTAGA
jgi:transposase